MKRTMWHGILASEQPKKKKKPTKLLTADFAPQTLEVNQLHVYYMDTLSHRVIGLLLTYNSILSNI